MNPSAFVKIEVPYGSMHVYSSAIALCFDSAFGCCPNLRPGLSSTMLCVLRSARMDDIGLTKLTMLRFGNLPMFANACLKPKPCFRSDNCCTTVVVAWALWVVLVASCARC
jgi:hypothetical protein